MTIGYQFIQVLSLILILHVPLSLLTLAWLYRRNASGRDLVFWGAVALLLPVVGAIAAYLYNRRESVYAVVKDD